MCPSDSDYCHTSSIWRGPKMAPASEARDFLAYRFGGTIRENQERGASAAFTDVLLEKPSLATASDITLTPFC